MPVSTGRVRWWILSLLFFATTINYLDRIVFAVLIPVIRQDLSLSTQQYGNITGAFQLAYTVGFLLMGKFVDVRGTRLGYAVSLAWWSVAAALHAFAGSALSLSFWRAVLGLGEAGNFPAAVKAVAEWFPRKDRAFATGIFNAGSNVASMIGPPVFAWLAVRYGWRSCFLLTGSLGLLWLIAWLLSYRLPGAHPAVSREELAYIESDQSPVVMQRLTWQQALQYRQTWGFALAKFFTDPVWWFYLYWLPLYLTDVRQLPLQQIGWALPVVYLMADFGSVGGGWFSGWLIRRGRPVAQARRIAMATCAFCMPVAALAVLAPGPVLTIALLGLATAAHQGWSANLYTLTSDVFPAPAVASVTGIGGCLGGFGGFLFSAILPGWIITHFGYYPMFAIMGVFHLIALTIVSRMVLSPGRRLPAMTTEAALPAR